MINKEDIEKLKKHCEKQIQLSEIFNDLKTAREHETILALIEENEQLRREDTYINQLEEENRQLKEASKTILRLESATYGLDTKRSENRWSIFKMYVNNCLADLEFARYSMSADEYIDKKEILKGVLAKMEELEKLNDPIEPKTDLPWVKDALDTLEKELIEGTSDMKPKGLMSVLEEGESDD